MRDLTITRLCVLLTPILGPRPAHVISREDYDCRKEVLQARKEYAVALLMPKWEELAAITDRVTARHTNANVLGMIWREHPDLLDAAISLSATQSCLAQINRLVDAEVTYEEM